MKNTTCFARRGRECNCLEVKYCPGYAKCSFYKNRAQYYADIEVCYARLRTLRPVAQLSIAGKYFDGKKPWKDSYTNVT